MPLKNRVTPYGEIINTPERGTQYGNRGVLHNDRGEIVRQSGHRAWIACVLEFKGRRRRLLMPGRFTELFFLDEATALAAGHRPCAECRRERFKAFREAWLRGNRRLGLPENALVTEIDRVLHRERIDRRGQKVTCRAALGRLPDGTFVEIEGKPHLVWGDRLLRWSPGGYLDARQRLSRSRGRRSATGLACSCRVTVLTPRSIVRAIAAGYRPAVHPSAQLPEPGASR